VPLLMPPVLFDRDVRGEMEVKMGEYMVIARRRETRGGRSVGLYRFYNPYREFRLGNSL
jgi:hypothetical protein